MRVFLFAIFATMTCDGPVEPTVYDSGDATCAEAWEVAEGCEGFELAGPDELPDSGDEPSWVAWCDKFNSSGIETIDTWCIAHAADCGAAAECLEH